MHPLGSEAFQEQRGPMYCTVHSTAVAFATSVAVVALLGCAPSEGGTSGSDREEPFDVLISGARVIDGTGNPWFRADVGIRGDVIAEIGLLSNRDATRTIEARDRIVSPGFIDMMGQSSLVLITDPPSAESKLRQGITTYLSGEGGSPAPQSAETQSSPLIIEGDTVRWSTYAEYFAIMERFGIPINVVHDVGLTQVRRVVLGEGRRSADSCSARGDESVGPSGNGRWCGRNLYVVDISSRRVCSDGRTH